MESGLMQNSQSPLIKIGPGTRILVVGDVMLDVIVKPEGPLVPGSDRKARIEHHPGGSASNQAAWLASLGADVALVAKVGRDDLKLQIDGFQKAGVTPFLAADDQKPSGVLVTLVNDDGQRSFLTDRGANDCLDASDFPDNLLEGVSILHISGYMLFHERPRLAVQELVSRATKAGIVVSIDPGSAGFIDEHGGEVFFDWTRGASICFPNEDEAFSLTGTNDVDEQRRILSGQYEFVVFKKGPKGAEICGPGGEVLVSLPALAVNAIDTTGAGDAFLAGFLSSVVVGKSLHDALGAAIGAGSKATTVFGGRPQLPD
jgi:sugar/nucleoside kinase (ribokinase family)